MGLHVPTYQYDVFNLACPSSPSHSPPWHTSVKAIRHGCDPLTRIRSVRILGALRKEHGNIPSPSSPSVISAGLRFADELTVVGLGLGNAILSDDCDIGR